MKLKILSLIFTLSMQTLICQESALDNHYKKEVIEKVSELIEVFYIYPEIAKKTNDYLYEKYKAGHFDSCKDNESFAKSLTEIVQSINKDKHMRIMANNFFEGQENTLERKAAQRMDQINAYKKYNHGFKEVKLLEDNVGYLDLRGFAQLERGREIADAYMKLLSQADAIIIDLTNNGGGDPAMVQYLCSYFFDKKLHLNSLYYREGNRTDEYWTLEEVGGKKLAEIPLFIMLGKETFSGAEEFSYNMQTQKRATLVGQTSAGAANPGRTIGINEYLAVFIPTGRPINPITKTSWEAVGVQPEIHSKKEETLAKALSLAQKAADSLRKSKLENYLQLHENLNRHLKEYGQEKSETPIHYSLKEFVNAGLFGEWDINNLGYEYLIDKSKPIIGLIILSSNTILFPESQDTFYNYGDALRINGDLYGAMENFQKALEMATKNNHKNISYYEEALQKVKSEIENKN